MKIQANKVDEFIKTFDDKIRGILIYGPDIGLVSIRKAEILNKVLPDYKNSLSLISLSSAILKERPTIIDDEYNSTSLFGGGRKVILIEDAENSLSKVLEPIFSKPQNANNFIIVTSGDLDSKSSLKKFAEYNQYFASLPCYKDDINSIMQIISLRLRNEGFKYSNDVVRNLAENFGGNRLVILNELDKLIMYKDTNKTITMDDVQACVQDSSEADINAFVNNFASLNFNVAYKELCNLYSEGIFPVVVIRSLINYFIKLQLYKFQLQNGLSFDEITTKENIFWKQKPILQQHLRKLSLENINDILFVLLKEECKLKGKED